MNFGDLFEDYLNNKIVVEVTSDNGEHLSFDCIKNREGRNRAAYLFSKYNRGDNVKVLMISNGVQTDITMEISLLATVMFD